MYVALWRGPHARTGGQPLAKSQQGTEDLSPTAGEALDPTSSHAISLEGDSSLTEPSDEAADPVDTLVAAL